MNRLFVSLTPLALVLFASFNAGAIVATDISVPDLVISNCDAVFVPVVVQSFAGVAGVELHFTYDETCMVFDSVSPGLLTGATVNGGAGQVHIIWEDFQNPLTLTDGDTVTGIRFSNITATTGSPCAVGFQSTCELVDEFGDPISLVTTDGSVACDGGGCCVMRGDVNHDGAELIDIADLLYLIDYMFTGGPAPVCFDEADTNASTTEPPDISDLLYLIDFMFTGGPAPTSCR